MVPPWSFGWPAREQAKPASDSLRTPTDPQEWPVPAYGLSGWERRIGGLAVATRISPAGPTVASDLELHIGELEDLAQRLEDSCLFIQGPPGSGKTWTGAQLIVSLIGGGARVGVAANSHKAIHNLLHDVEATADSRGSSPVRVESFRPFTSTCRRYRVGRLGRIKLCPHYMAHESDHFGQTSCRLPPRPDRSGRTRGR